MKFILLAIFISSSSSRTSVADLCAALQNGTVSVTALTDAIDKVVQNTTTSESQDSKKEERRKGVSIIWAYSSLI
jgi:predicted RNA-binding protein associated with RNAse of E/G family